MATPVSKSIHSSKTEKSLHVLVVDDDDFQTTLISDILRNLGVVGITCVNSGKAAMGKIGATPAAYSLILIDLHMPGMDGFEFMDCLAQANYSGAIVIVSGQSEAVLHGASLVAKLRRFNLLGVLNKPVTQADLSRLLQSAR